jgi:hypothetical protein
LSTDTQVKHANAATHLRCGWGTACDRQFFEKETVPMPQESSDNKSCE